MFKGVLGRKRNSKCKSLIKITKTRLETIRKKRAAVQKYLKNDVADLLKSGLDYNAYGRAEGLLIEMNMTSCYCMVEQFCGCVYDHATVMHKQRECPEECKEAVPSLMFAAARFSDLPELRDLRKMFTDKYGNSLDSFTNEEFVGKMMQKHPTKEMKIQLMQDIALEFAIQWDPKALEQKLYVVPTPETVRSKNVETENDDYKWRKSKEEDVTALKGNEPDRSSYGSEEITNDGYKQHSSAESEDSELHKYSNPVKDRLEEEADERKPFFNGLVPPPYLKQKVVSNGMPEKNQSGLSKSSGHLESENSPRLDSPRDDADGDQGRPKPRSVRRRNLKPPPGHHDHNRGTRREEARVGLQNLLPDDHYQKDEPGNAKYFLKPPPLGETDDTSRNWSTDRSRLKSDSIFPAVHPTSPIDQSTRRHARASSMQPEMLNPAGHVHPKLPDCDDLAARIAALRGS